MQRITDDVIAVPITRQTKQNFGTLRSISMDKGFDSKANREQLERIVDVVVLPKKGRLSAAEQERQARPEFVRLRHQHSAVESAINALEQHGLDVCPDHGIGGFKRLGAVLREQEQKQAERLRRPYKLAA
jgi:uncharacterized protein YnzC (UPF0291/DUF896 family)